MSVVDYYVLGALAVLALSMGVVLAILHSFKQDAEYIKEQLSRIEFHEKA